MLLHLWHLKLLEPNKNKEDPDPVLELHSAWKLEKGVVSHTWLQLLTSETGCPNLFWLL